MRLIPKTSYSPFRCQSRRRSFERRSSVDTQKAVQELKAERVQEELVAAGVAKEELSRIWLKAERVQEPALSGAGSEGAVASIVNLGFHQMERVAIELLALQIVITAHGTKAGGGAVGAVPATTAGESR